MYNSILRQFQIEDKILQTSPFGSGHINDTYKVETEGKTYILQRINSTIFKDIEGLTGNIQKISTHLQKNYSAPKKVPFLHFYTTKEGLYYFVDRDGLYWRLMDYIRNSFSYDRAESEELAYGGGVTIGQFLRNISTFPPLELKETLPQFHHIGYRINNLLEAIEMDIVGRVKETKEEITFALDRTQKMGAFLQYVKDKNIPLRALHNDTKISNILFDAAGKGICMIDLDTLMPGFIHYDYGDAIRTFCSTADEDETDLSKVDFNKEYYQAFTQGFLQETKDFITQSEKDSLSFAPKLLTYIMGIRFLTDYLNGDIYYKVKHPNHNIDRARNQFHLLKKMEFILPYGNENIE